MTAGWGNPADDANASTSRPSATLTGAGVRKWFDDAKRTLITAQDLNGVLGMLRNAVQQAGITDAEGDDTLLWQAIKSLPRPRLTGNTTYYVRTDGNDGNDGLTNTAGGAFLTVQAAFNKLMAVDCNGYPVTIQAADGPIAPPPSCSA